MDKNPIHKEQERTWMKNVFKRKADFHPGSPVLTTMMPFPLISQRGYMHNPTITLHTENNLPAPEEKE
jgi:hypothetical protein